MRQNTDYAELEGTVKAIIYQNSENGYTVMRLDVGGEEAITAVGFIPYASPGENLHLAGTWSSHAAYGQQFKVEWATRSLPHGSNAIYEYLASNVIKGIGPKTAKQIVERFGEKTLEIIENEPERLSEIRGISPKKAIIISAAFKTQAGVRILMEFLMNHGLKPRLAMKLHKCYGDNAINAIRDNPYILADTYFGSEFSLADKLALELGFEYDSTQRLEAGILYVLIHNLGNGHTFIPREKLVNAVSSLLKVHPDACDRVVDTLEDSGRIVLGEVAGTTACYLEEMNEAEEYVARHILEMSSIDKDIDVDESPLIDEVESSMGIQYASSQREAVKIAATNRITVLTGAPGTGKTTTVRAILALFDKMELKTALAAPTGRAAKRLSELTDAEAVTIHRLLGAGYSGDSDELVFEKCESDPLEVDAVILDEASMVDIMLARALFAAMSNNCRLVLVGDADQLPSVGPGNFFSDILRSGAVPVIRLSEIFRQAGQSAIIRNAHLINSGQMPELSDKSSDFFYLRKNRNEETVETIMDLCARRLPENMGIPSHDIQVLSPFKRSISGTINLNKSLQEALNPPSPEKREKKYGEIIFRQGDKVMQIRNNYDIMWKKPDLTTGLGIFNGDIGKILEINHKEETLIVDYDERRVTYSFDMLGEIELAYAMTVHKSQGSEYRAVIFVAQKGPAMLLNRKILYTAVTRAKELFIAVGDLAYIQAMVNNDRQQKRYSGVKFRLAGE